jgi:pyrroline-5-carboxylate reductase
MSRVGFIGGGKMAEAIISDMIKSRTFKPHEVFVSDISEERRRILKNRHGVNVLADNGSLPGLVEILFLAVKPQNLDEALKDLAGRIKSGQLVISIIAGKRIKRIEALLPEARIVRVMPNLAALVSESMSVFCAGKNIGDEERKTVTALLAGFGKALELPEEQFDAVTALSGSGPAYFACFVGMLVSAGEKLGLAGKDAELLAEQTMLGTARLLMSGEFSTESLIKAVSSEKGTTAAGMAALNASDVGDVISRALEAAARRSEELSR